MLATAEQTTHPAVRAARRAVATAALPTKQPSRFSHSNPPAATDDPVPALASASASRSVRRMAKANTGRAVVQDRWTNRPADWTPYASWEEAVSGWSAARNASLDAFVALRALSTPFINGGATDPEMRHAYIFAKTIDDALAKAPNLPADLVAASRTEASARAHEEHVRRRATQTPVSGLNILSKMRMITEYIDDVFDPLEPSDVRAAHKHADDFPMANEFYALHDDIVRAVSTNQADDGESLAMSRELTRRFSLELAETDDAKIDDAVEHSAAMAHAIMERPARSFADLRAKAEVVQWACSGRAELDEAFGGRPGSSYMLFAHRLLTELLDGTAEAPYVRLDRRTDPWAEKVAERSRIVDWVNAMVETLPPGTDDTAYFEADMVRQAELVVEIERAPIHDPQARAAKIRLCLNQDAEGFDMGARALELLRQLEATLPPSPGHVIQ